MNLFYKIEPCPLCHSQQIELCQDGNSRLKDQCKCRECGCTALRSSWEMRESHIAASASEPVAKPVWCGCGDQIMPDDNALCWICATVVDIPLDAKAIRDAALERAAMICDGVNSYDNPMTAGDCADAIRALKSSTDGEPTNE